MGAYCPAPVATPEVMHQVLTKVLKPAIKGMRKEKHPYIGILYAGIILTESGPKCLEFNCRFGDPETQVLLPSLSKKCDLAEVMMVFSLLYDFIVYFQACCEGRLDCIDVKFEDKFAVTVVASSKGYPGPYEKGKTITLPTNIPKGLFHFPSFNWY